MQSAHMHGQSVKPLRTLNEAKKKIDLLLQFRSGKKSWNTCLYLPSSRSAKLLRVARLIFGLWCRNCYRKFQMFWQQILQLGDALVYSVTSLLFDQTVGQLGGLLEAEKRRPGEVLAAQSRPITEGKCVKGGSNLPCCRPRASWPAGACTHTWGNPF